jgi:hypothetical protein
VSRYPETPRPNFGESNGLLLERRGNLDIFIPFCNMNLLIAFHTILQNEDNSRREEEVEDAGQEESSDGGHEDFEQEDEGT